MEEKKLSTLLTKLAGANPSATVAKVEKSTNALFVEKLASAVEFVVDSLQVVAPTPEAAPATAEKVAAASAPEATALGKLLHQRLKEKVAAKEQAVVSVANENKQKLAAAVLAKLKTMKVSTVVATPEPEIVLAKEAAEEETFQFDTKEAIEGQESLADVLAGALGHSEVGGSSTVGETKTAEAETAMLSKKEVTAAFKQKLLAKRQKGAA